MMAFAMVDAILDRGLSLMATAWWTVNDVFLHGWI